MPAKPKKQQWELEFDDGDYYNNYDSVDNFVCSMVRKYTDKEWEAKLASDPWAYKEIEQIVAVGLTSDESCCGFPVLAGWECGKMPDEVEKEVVKRFKEWMVGRHEVLKNKGYMSAYIPDQKTYETARRILKGAGFVEGVKLKSNHGPYTNTRWEWFDNKKVKPPKYK